VNQYKKLTNQIKNSFNTNTGTWKQNFLFNIEGADVLQDCYMGFSGVRNEWRKCDFNQQQ
jgi:hypothetical protein